MKREEAIRVLEDNRPSVIFEDEHAQKRMAELCQAIDMAIEALSEVRCNDCKWKDDVIEVVRCKDCKWYYVINPKVERGLCEFEARPRSRKARSDSDFCSYGERKYPSK